MEVILRLYRKSKFESIGRHLYLLQFSALEIRSKFGILGFVDEREPENPQNMNKQTNKVKERA